MADVDWEKLGKEWVVWREEWRSAATDKKQLKETEVREKLMVPLLAALGWAPNEYHTEVICSIKVGSDKAKEVEADYVLAPRTCVQIADGKNFWNGVDSPWAVIEVKRPGQMPIRSLDPCHANRQLSPCPPSPSPRGNPSTSLLRG